MRTLLMVVFLVACADGGPGLGDDRHDAMALDGGVVTDGGTDGCSCEGLLVCLPDGGCGDCGGLDEPCCSGGGCEAGLLCADGVCAACGGVGEACCLGDVPCPDGGACVSGLCRDETGPDPCDSPARECDPGETDERPCGACGVQTRLCDDTTCGWGEWDACEGEGTCEPGSVTTDGCGACTARTCTGTCEWETTCDTCTCAEMVVCTVDTCPAGYHIAETLCIPGCSGFCDPAVNANAVRCVPNCATSFTTCGRTCPEGYFVNSRSCELNMPLQCVEHNCAHPDQNAVECRRL